ncbi:MAG TPA: hypothetical protein VFV94_10505 [Polyangiaceae bacterium]|jgi:hypothetical protein|nr:hypothetical protein [Polyangiaceae bacterium]
MLIRTTLLGAAVVSLLGACSGSSKEFSSPPPGGTGGTASSGGSAGASSGKGGGNDKGGATSAGGTSGSAPAGGGTSIDEAAAAVAVDLCTKAFECCSADAIKALYGVDTVIGCEVAVAFLVQAQVNAAKPAIEAGRVEYDGTALDRCLGDYGDQTCDELRALTGFQCEGLIVPRQGEGDECGISAECIEGYCDGSSNAASPVGHCVPLKDDGAECAANPECVSQFCSAGRCEAPSSQPLCGE